MEKRVAPELRTVSKYIKNKFVRDGCLRSTNDYAYGYGSSSGVFHAVSGQTCSRAAVPCVQRAVCVRGDAWDEIELTH
jgi:hypothetical protein